MQIPAAFEHQAQTTKFVYDNPRVFITKTPAQVKLGQLLMRFCCSCYKSYRPPSGLAPLSIVQASWGDDIEKFGPNLTYSLRTQPRKAFKADSNIIITNHDAAKWLKTQPCASRSTWLY